ncbi:hypothetical protein Ae717Ps2_6642c [Pseudonocardia sp. Ae717_Ps2]|nr:hypothetical protein Ae717Ps2_6600c [Pseudonocardia sp. Ae717_Ps2]OLM28303.1 hypothetical protein Ae717Ps2_6642c [Pseudonocardia sp. Ae717_Ps2]
MTGVNLTGQLGLRTGKFYVNIDSPTDPDFSRIIPFDEFNSPSAYHTINGPTARVSVHVEPTDPPTGRSCNYSFVAEYPGPT